MIRLGVLNLARDPRVLWDAEVLQRLTLRDFKCVLQEVVSAAFTFVDQKGPAHLRSISVDDEGAHSVPGYQPLGLLGPLRDRQADEMRPSCGAALTLSLVCRTE